MEKGCYDSDNCFGVSVIIPVYNTLNYLHKCLDSICGQTYDNLEIILVDDESTDGSGQICDEYVLRDKRVKCIHIAHSNQIGAMKAGINEASMPFVFFSDSDDWIDDTLIERLINAAGNKVQLVTSGLLCDVSNHEFILNDCFTVGEYDRKSIKKCIIPEMMHRYCGARQGIVSSKCGKLFIRTILKDTLAQIDNELTIGEDGATVYLYILNIDSMVITDICGYHYVKRDDSITHTYTYDSFRKIEKLTDFLRKNIRLNGKSINTQIDEFVSTFIGATAFSIFGLDMTLGCYNKKLEQLNIPDKSKIILYGAGRIGKKCYANIRNENRWNIVAWVDRNYAEINDIYIVSPEVINKVEFDFIFISLADKTIVEEITENLCSIGVQRDRIKSIPIE